MRSQKTDPSCQAYFATGYMRGLLTRAIHEHSVFIEKVEGSMDENGVYRLTLKVTLVGDRTVYLTVSDDPPEA